MNKIIAASRNSKVKESLIFPIIIRGYGEIQGMTSWQVFIKHYRQLAEICTEQKKYIETLEACAKQLTGDDVEYLKPEHYKMVGETINDLSNQVETAIDAAEGNA